MDFLVFGGAEHGGDSNEVQVFEFLPVLALHEEFVHDLDAPEEGLFAHFVGGEDLDHPVDHLRSEAGGDAVPAEEILAVV